MMGSMARATLWRVPCRHPDVPPAWVLTSPGVSVWLARRRVTNVPASNPGGHLMSGRVVHFEIPYDDGDRARAFYQAAFGWQLMSLPDMGYTLAMTGPSGDQGPTEPGFINGGMMQ